MGRFPDPQAHACPGAGSYRCVARSLFARADAGGLYLLNNKADGATYGYGSNGTDKAMFTGTLEAGLLF